MKLIIEYKFKLPLWDVKELQEMGDKDIIELALEDWDTVLNEGEYSIDRDDED